MRKIFKKKTSENDALLNRFPSRSGYAESYRTLRTNLQFTSMDKELKTLCVTSATEQEGKTTTVANLAYTMAQAGQRVLMVDCDLRKPGLTNRFGFENDPGLTELISKDLGAMITSGSMSDIRLNDLIKLNRLQKRTGILSIKDSNNQVDISFNNGNLTDIFWKNRPEKQRLASTLVNQQLLTTEQARIALGHQKKSVQKLGAILTTMGMISKSELKRHLSVHIVEAFKTAVAMLDGSFTFTSLPVNRIENTIEHNVNFDKLFLEFMDEEDQSPYLRKIIESRIMPTDTEKLFLMPSGKIPPNPSEMISSQKMMFVLDNLATLFDFVIIDTPPVLPASDALMIVPKTDGILMVVKANAVNKKYLKDAISQLEASNTKILGLTPISIGVIKWPENQESTILGHFTM